MKAGERRWARRGSGHRKVVGFGQTLMGNDGDGDGDGDGDDEVVGEVEIIKRSGVVRMRRVLMKGLGLKLGTIVLALLLYILFFKMVKLG